MNVEWMSIETAPKDGTRIILFDNNRLPSTLIGKWRHGNWWGDLTNSGRAILWRECTHWMPIPEPPIV